MSGLSYSKAFNAAVSTAPILFSFSITSPNLFDKVIYINTDANIRLERLMKRNGLSKNEALKRIKAQIPDREKIKKCDLIINNNGNQKDLEKELIKILELSK